MQQEPVSICKTWKSGREESVFVVSEVLLLIGRVTAIIFSLDILENRLHLLGLTLPLLVTHLGLASEKLLVGLAVAATQTIPKRSELAVVVVEVQVVHGVAGGTVDDGTVGNVLAVVNEDGPEVDEAEQEDVGQFLQREEEGEDVVGHTLRPAVERVESVRSEGGGHDPLVVRLVEGLVDAGVVQAAVDPVDEEIGEADEEWELDEAVEWEWLFGDGVVEFGVSSDLQNEEGCSQQGHWGHGLHGLSDFHRNLVSQEFGVVVSGFVPDKDV